MMDLGRFDLIPSRKGLAGVVIGAPHGTYDNKRLRSSSGSDFGPDWLRLSRAGSPPRKRAVGDLRLYFDVHQYGGSSIQIATTGVSAAQAQNLKQRYRQLRDRLLTENPDIEPVKLLIEPQDEVEIGAWPAKAHGILSLARKSVHVELPLHSALGSEKSPNVYIRIVSELITQAVQDLSN
jgi:hypothetical protein